MIKPRDLPNSQEGEFAIGILRALGILKDEPKEMYPWPMFAGDETEEQRKYRESLNWPEVGWHDGVYTAPPPPKLPKHLNPIVKRCTAMVEQHKDNVNHPSHYTQGGIECIDALKAATVGLEGIQAVDTANAIKYLWRWSKKNGVEDLKKAQFYINHLIKEVEKDYLKNESERC